MKKHFRERLLNEHRGMVLRIARQVKNGCPYSVELSDLVAVGMVGLWEAIQRFSPDKESQFWSYARPRVIGSMRDWLRKQDQLKRSSRSIAKKIESTYFSCGPQSDTADRIAATGLDAEKYHKYSTLVGSHTIPIDHQDLFTLRDKQALLERISEVAEQSPLDAAIISQQREILLKAMSTLPVRQRQVVLKYLVQGLDQVEIAVELGISASRVSQLLTTALERLRKRIIACGLSQKDIHSIK